MNKDCDMYMYMYLVVHSCHEGGVAFNIPFAKEARERGRVVGEDETQLSQAEGHNGGGYGRGRRGGRVTLALVTGPGGRIWGVCGEGRWQNKLQSH